MGISLWFYWISYIWNYKKVMNKLFSYKNLIISLSLITICFLAYIYVQKTQLKPIVQKNQQANSYYTVQEITDGDTIVLNNGEIIRYLGIDTPELHHPKIGEECGGKDAKEENLKLLEGKKVRLEKDTTDKDDYGRLLRFVFTDDGYFVNYEIIRRGWAQILPIPPDTKFDKVFLDAQLTAKKEKLGIWSKCFKNSEGGENNGR